MKRFLTQFLLAGLGLAFVATPAFAQGGLMVGGGLTLPRGDYADGVKSGYHLMGGLLFHAPGAPLGIRADAGYHLNDLDVAGDPDAKSNILAVSGDAVYAFPGVGARPYVLGGVTWASIRCRGDDCLSDNSDSDVGYNIGGGVNLGGIFAEARYVKIGGDVDAAFIPITVGFRF